MSKKKKRARGHLKNEITKGIFTVLEKEPNKAFNYKQIASKLQLKDTESRNLLIRRLGELKNEKRITEKKRGSYGAIERKNTFKGKIEITAKGNAYVLVDDLEEDIFIPFHRINRAFHGDIVEVFVNTKKGKSKKEGEIVKVLERNKTTFVGIVELQKKFAFVNPTDTRMYTDIFIPIEKVGNAKNGDKVLVEITEWPESVDSPYGEVLEVLGKPGEHQTEIHAILAEYGLPYKFPEEVEAFANKIDTSIKAEEIKKRRDLRDTLTFTIDPKDAKDFDDALSFEKLDNGNFSVGIHIADVSHYVKPGTILEEEAYERATSVYLVDRVVPMLPEILSNNACSLRPHEDKYTFSAIFELDSHGIVKKEWFGRTVINSNERFAYEEAQHVIENKDTIIPEEISIRGSSYEIKNEVVDAILQLDSIAKEMRQKRMDDGAISFDKVEVKFQLSDKNEPEGVFFKEAKDANKLIEEFMLLANRKVAEFIGKQRPAKTFVYRIHDQPDEEKLLALNSIIRRFGHHLNLKDRKSVNSSLNQLLEDVKGKKEQNLVDTLAIRSMSKAVYSTDNIGHYGLSFEYYTHFTSPIRRYPDVMVHRLLQNYLDNGKSAAKKEYEILCKHSSDMENLASNAERDSIKYMQIRFMENHMDQEFKGVISGVTEWGIYVEIIENKCEGMVRIRDIKDDYYTFDEKEYAIIGQRNHKKYQLGDEVIVMVKSTDLVKRHLDFRLLGKAGNSN